MPASRFKILSHGLALTELLALLELELCRSHCQMIERKVHSKRKKTTSNFIREQAWALSDVVDPRIISKFDGKSPGHLIRDKKCQRVSTRWAERN
jgi:hypothetical protein